MNPWYSPYLWLIAFGLVLWIICSVDWPDSEHEKTRKLMRELAEKDKAEKDKAD